MTLGSRRAALTIDEVQVSVSDSKLGISKISSHTVIEARWLVIRWALIRPPPQRTELAFEI